jgi:MFS family permease
LKSVYKGGYRGTVRYKKDRTVTTQMIRQILTRDFILCCFAQLVLAFVFYSLIPTLPIYLSRLGSNEAEIGVLIGIFAVSSLVLRPFVGRALLTIPEKKFMIAGALLSALASAAFLWMPPFWPVLIVRIFQGIAFAFFQTASFTLVANISSESHRGQSLSYLFLASNTSGAFAPSLGMFLINHFGFTLLFLVCSGLSLIALFITHRLRRRPVVPSDAPCGEEGFFLSRKALPPSIVSCFAFISWGALGAFFPLYAIQHDVTNPGFFFSTFAIMLILGRGLGGKILDRYSKDAVILPSLLAYIISMVILAFSKTLPMFILVAVIYGIGHAFLIPTLMVYVLDRVGGSSPGPAMGTITAISDLGISLGPGMMGIIVQSTSYPTMFLCLAFTGVINLNYFYFFIKKKG